MEKLSIAVTVDLDRLVNITQLAISDRYNAKKAGKDLNNFTKVVNLNINVLHAGAFSKPKEVKLNLEVYTGACTHYKLNYANSQPNNNVVVRQGTGVVVINRTWNTLRFFFENEPIVYDRVYTSSKDEAIREETFDNGGNEYAICNYKTQSFELLEGKYLDSQRDQYVITDFKRQLHTLKVKNDSTELT